MEVGASIVAFVQITGAIVKICQDTIHTLKEAPEIVQLVLGEIKVLEDFISRYAGRVQSTNPFEECSKLLEKLKITIPTPKNAVVPVSNGAQPNSNGSLKDKLTLSMEWLRVKSKVGELLAQISREKASMLLVITNTMADDIHEIKLQVCKLNENLTQQERNQICSWIEMINPTPKHNESTRWHDQKTSGWATRTKEWNNWLARSAGSRLVWLFGIPGAGKTILTSYLIEQAKEALNGVSGVMVIYYYCVFSQGQDATESFLRWIVSQMIRETGAAPENIKTKYKLNHSPSIDNLEAAIEVLLGRFTAVYILIDGVDESQNSGRLAEALVNLSTSLAFQNIWLLASSRKLSEIATPFRGKAIEFSMSNPELQKDIRTFVNNELPRRKKLERFRDLFPKIEERLSQQADGMFRLAVCQIDLLERQRTQQGIQSTLESLPETIYDTYDQIFQSIPRNDWHFVRSILKMIFGHDIVSQAYLSPTLYLSVLLSWVELDIQNSDYNSADLEELCGCLVNISLPDHNTSFGGGSQNGKSSIPVLESAIVSLAHFTVREFLESEHIKKSPVRFFKLSKASTATEFSFNIMRRVCSIDTNDMSPEMCKPVSRFPYSHTNYYFFQLALELVIVILRPSSRFLNQEGLSGLDPLPESRNEILSLVVEFLLPDSNLMSLLRRPGQNDEVPSQKSGLHRLIADLSEFPSHCTPGFEYEVFHATDKISPKLSVLWILLSTWNVPLGLDVLGSLDAHERRDLLAETITVCDWFKISRSRRIKWMPKTEAPWTCLGTLPEIFAQVQFLVSLRDSGRPAWLRPWSILEQFGNSFEITSFLDCYIYSHARDCGNKTLKECAPYCLLEKLLDLGADPNGSGMSMTPLQVAAERWDFHAIELLLRKGADANAIGVGGKRYCLGWKLEYATWSPLRIYRHAPCEPFYTFTPSCYACHKVPPLFHETFRCIKCESPYSDTDYHSEYLDTRRLQVEKKAEIDVLLVSNGAKEI
ncbi:hypothetical protein TWF718_003427 [Orbilia javanica]|uniref:Nephrocystin 3-like N-terminal domain-containing protein n=1 Tax=Orbilia javanica TaxID=47235 RepID=A0AAN8RJ17_9PEZI